MNSSSATHLKDHVLYFGLCPIEQLSWSHNLISVGLLLAHDCCQSLYSSP
jgi:hypothetical protein